MKDLLPLIIVLTLIAGIAGLALALVNAVTEEPITAAEREATLKAIRIVLPAFDDANLQSVTIGEGEEAREVFVARDGSNGLVGVALTAVSPNGYGGDLVVMLGIIQKEGAYVINDLVILRHAETPGLGTKVAEEKFKGQFRGVNFESLTFAVKKDDAGTPDKPPIDGVTGATISSRAVTEASEKGLRFFTEHLDAILAAKAGEGDGQ